MNVKPKSLASLLRQARCGAVVDVGERGPDELDRSTHAIGFGTHRTNRGKAARPVKGAARSQRTRRAAGNGAAPLRPPTKRTCDAFAALGHPVRAKMLLKLLAGPATYQAIKKLTKLEPGPLYHHVNQLRLAGLILPKQRDLYELTRGGRNLILGAAALAPMIGDKRRRPVG